MASGGYDECAEGHLVRVGSNARGESFTASLLFNNSISIAKPGYYSVSFFTFFYCTKVGCENAKDKISLKIKDGSSSEFLSVGEDISRVKDNQWVQVSRNFEVTQNQIEVRN